MNLNILNKLKIHTPPRFLPIVFTIVFTIIFIFLSPHWFIKHEYWANNKPLPEFSTINLAYNNEPEIDKNYSFITYPNNNIFETDVDITKTGELTIKFPKYTFSGKRLDINSFLINNQECKNKLENNKYKIYVNNGDKLNLKISYIQNITPFPLLKKINYFAFVVSLIFYLAIFYFLFYKIFSLETKDVYLYIKDFLKKHRNEIFLFILFLTFYLILNCKAAMHINYCIGSGIGEGNDGLLVAPTIWYSITRRFHPYFFLPFYPLFDTLIYITNNLFLSLVIIFSTLASSTVVFLYKSLNTIFPDKKYLMLLLTCIFGFSYSQIFASYSMDLYIITSFYLTIILYLILQEMKSDKYSFLNMFLIVLFSSLSFGITIPNIITILLLTIPIFILKKNIKIILIIIFSFLLLTAGLLEFKSATCRGAAWKAVFYTNTYNEAKMWINPEVKSNIIPFVKSSLISPLIKLSNKFNSYAAAVFVLGFFLLLVCTIVLCFRKDVSYKDRLIFYSLLSALLYNFIANFFWYPIEGFLFSPNHFAIWFVIMGYSFKIIDDYLSKFNKKIDAPMVYLLLIIFIMIQLPANIIANREIQQEAIKNYPLTYNLLEGKNINDEKYN